MKRLLFSLFVILPFVASSQPIVAGSDSDERLRVAQLSGMVSNKWSLMVRPVYESKYLLNDSDAKATNFIWIKDNPRRGLWVEATPVILSTYTNSKFPWGNNDRGVWQSRGLNTSVRAGVRAGFKFIEVQLQPEWIKHENADFDTLTSFLYRNALWQQHERRIDTPLRPRDTTYTRLFPGQSYIKFNFRQFQAGVSSENMWWGPGLHQAMLISNNAPGFPHVFIGTRAPLKTYIGAFETRIFGGRLENSGQKTFPRPDRWRYVTGFNFTYMPSFLPGLSVGLNRVFQTNEKEFDGNWKSYIPFLQDFLKKNVSTEIDPLGNDLSDQIVTLSARWSMPESRAEFYGEFARADHAWDLRDLTLQPEHTSGYLLGFRKDVLKSKKRHFLTGIEFSKLEKTNTRLTRPAPDLYEHHLVTDGWTNYGQIMSTFIGAGSNSRIVTFTYMDQKMTIGMKLMHLTNNNSFYYQDPAFRNDRWRHWVDLVGGLNASYRYKNIVASGQLNLIKSLNRYYVRDNDHVNINTSFSLQYGL